MSIVKEESATFFMDPPGTESSKVMTKVVSLIVGFNLLNSLALLFNRRRPGAAVASLVVNTALAPVAGVSLYLSLKKYPKILPVMEKIMTAGACHGVAPWDGHDEAVRIVSSAITEEDLVLMAELTGMFPTGFLEEHRDAFMVGAREGLHEMRQRRAA